MNAWPRGLALKAPSCSVLLCWCSKSLAKSVTVEQCSSVCGEVQASATPSANVETFGLGDKISATLAERSNSGSCKVP